MIKLLCHAFYINKDYQITGSLSDITLQDELIHIDKQPNFHNTFYSGNN